MNPEVFLRLGAEGWRVAVRRVEAGERSAILGVEVTACIEGYHAVMVRTAAPGLPGELRRKRNGALAVARHGPGHAQWAGTPDPPEPSHLGHRLGVT